MPDSAPPVFFDANVLLYLASEDEWRAGIAEALLLAGGTISVQILNEIANVLRRKRGASWPATIEFIERLQGLLDVVPLTLSIHKEGLRLAQRHRLAVYDGMVVAAALNAGCNVLLSEDMHDGLVVDSKLTVRNPFVLPNI
jgi:predicted nucleic acid-binding protein